MSWFAVDDRFHSHRKVLRLRSAHSVHYATGLALWTLAGTWACGQDVERFTGRVPVDVLSSFGVPDWRGALDALVLVGLWTCDGEVVAFHDWDAWNGTGSFEHRSRHATAMRTRATRIRKCESGQHSKDCPTVDLEDNPRDCPRRVERDRVAPRSATSGRAGTGRDGKGSPRDTTNVVEWPNVAEHLRTPEQMTGGAS